MDDPENQVEHVIRSLTVQSRQDQSDALEEYFLPDAYFIHPFCRVPSFGDYKIPLTNQIINSRWLIFFIYQWYRILSPEIKLEIKSASFDKKTDLLYVSIRQSFTLWFVPFSLWQANVGLVTVLQLQRKATDRNHKPILKERPGPDNNDLSLSYQPAKLYFIKGQEDHYQVEDFLKFIAPWGVSLFWIAWQLFATFICAVGVLVLRKPIVVFRERVLGLDSKAIKKE
ncbi:hypothetical protein F4781DRAFT_431438 [Annulohypoxylon bovei var. microspora]|nr:hypothetical protein F4781DRAFT_431438 [Annulohypoxylon bovei var. microspora]